MLKEIYFVRNCMWAQSSLSYFSLIEVATFKFLVRQCSLSFILDLLYTFTIDVTRIQFKIILSPHWKFRAQMFYFQKEENKYGEKQMKNWAENRNLVLKHFDIVVHWTTYYYLLTFIFLWSMRDWGSITKSL